MYNTYQYLLSTVSTVSTIMSILFQNDKPGSDITDPVFLDKYIIRKVIGRGTFSTVYKGQKRYGNLGYVTIKKVSKTKYSSKSGLFSWSSEEHALRNCSHIQGIQKYIETIHDRDGDTVYLITEYIKGNDLYTYLNRVKKGQQIPEREIRNIFGQLIRIVRQLHDMEYSHRDIKLENIMIDLDHTVYLIDLGFMLKDVLPIKSTAGSPEYASPELLSRRPYHGRNHDIWCLGVILYILIYLEYPYSIDDDDDNIEVLLNSDQQPTGIMGPKAREKLFDKIQNTEPSFSSSHTKKGTSFYTEPLLEISRRLLYKDFRKRPTIKELDLFFNKNTGIITSNTSTNNTTNVLLS